MQRKKIQEACHQEYPQILDQIHSDHGLLSLLKDQLIDVEFLDVTSDMEQWSRQSGRAIGLATIKDFSFFLFYECFCPIAYPSMYYYNSFPPLPSSVFM